jgi:hypothetical protein
MRAARLGSGLLVILRFGLALGEAGVPVVSAAAAASAAAWIAANAASGS